MDHGLQSHYLYQKRLQNIVDSLLENWVLLLFIFSAFVACFAAQQLLPEVTCKL